jgi:hypothetical protein
MKKQPLQKMFLGKLDIYIYETEARSLFLTLHQFQLKVDKDLNMKSETLKQI